MRNRWERLRRMDDGQGEMVSAPDIGKEGDKTYPMAHPWGWWENEMLQVLFKCKT